MEIRHERYRVVASYQLFSDMPGYLWADEVLREAKQDDLIEDFEITGVHPMRYGIQLIQFTVDLGMHPNALLADWDHLKEIFTSVVNMIVHDTDAEVHTFYPPIRAMTVVPLPD